MICQMISAMPLIHFLLIKKKKAAGINLAGKIKNYKDYLVPRH